jgi:RNA polymerase subunit RPABC4/transcription elongation factor Spt4
MEEESPNHLLNERARRADKIVRNPEKYKICAGCESIIAVKVSICPNCHAYRFMTERNMVILQAQQLANREPRSVAFRDMD